MRTFQNTAGARGPDPRSSSIWPRATALCAALLVLLASAAADAGRRHRAPPPHPDDVFVAEGRGCYWARGAMTCSRFCYLEADGRRYCQPRSAHAFPQALPNYWAQQYGGRPERYRPRVEVAPDYRGRPWVLAPRRDVD